MDDAGEYGAVAGRSYWDAVLDAVGRTPLPRWTPTGPGAPGGTATHRTALPAPGVTPALLLAAHAKVLAALTGEPDTVSGYLPAGGAPLAARVSVQDGSWAGLAAAAERTRRSVVRHAAHAPDTAPSLFDTLVAEDPAALAADLPQGVNLAVATDGRELVLRHRTDTLDAGAAARVGGYYLAALDGLTARPDSAHQDRTLLSDDEVRTQTEEFAGPDEPLPDLRCHQLFEERARLRPGDTALVRGGQRLTYGELNRHANRIARQLRLRGLRDEDVVAVVTERDFGWAAAVLGVLKAGGVYLPVEPHFPAARIETVLRRSDCRYVLTAHGACPSLDTALAALTAPAEGPSGTAGGPDVSLVDALPEGLADHDPLIPVRADQLAYIYFTSGSTGEPKGAMCEHAGFTNHLLAKTADLGITEGTTVAQTAPQCFDISLWQLVAALTTGGTTHLVEQEALLDPARFVETLRGADIEVVQLVPSYLEVLLTFLDGDRTALPALRRVSVTGEALKKELAQRWFATFPAVPLVNAYGLTETCDDTNHEVLLRAPSGPSVPLGRPVRNVRVYVVDERLRPVPLGAPGEIVFSGVCVGRGYVNDEERSRAAFLPDPYRPGERLYRSGDFGRWAPDGRLEFHGRRDAQLKIRGFRIELGEIENRLLQVAGVRDGAVVVAGAAESRHLVGYYTGPAELAPADVAAALAGALPGYMVPARLERRDALPLTANGKTDRKTLTREAAAGEQDGADGGGAPGAALPDAYTPRTAMERRLAGLWAGILRADPSRIGRTTHFYEAGGTSLTAVRLAISLDRLVTVKELAATPVLADLADLLQRRLAARTEGEIAS
ncbi:amino acid adenylation domain-containing protein [Streptomyces sp. NPDC059398]|uniref:non-ribosomal peptide synthetase n=1 Tax=Streptomyces sp. NPDC059398 TaxID=3346820 RepID=UPI0036AA6B38